MSAHPQSAPMLGVIVGSTLIDVLALPGMQRRDVETARGVVRVQVTDDVVFLARHGTDVYHPPHRIPHHAHVLALESLGVRQVAAFASTGALRPELQPGDMLIPDDYISWHPPPTFAADEYLHIVPQLDPGVRDLLRCAAREAVTDSPAAPVLVYGGTYVETRGPRFETAAEVRVLAQYADVVGMTAASEATLFQERAMGYAVLCIIDNHAHGVGPTQLTLEAYRAQLADNASLADLVLHELVRTWRAS